MTHSYHSLMRWIVYYFRFTSEETSAKEVQARLPLTQEFILNFLLNNTFSVTASGYKIKDTSGLSLKDK